MAVISMKALLESGVHFGHRTHKWHPGMKPYIFTERNGIHIIDLQKTAKSLEQAYTLVTNKVSEGGLVLFVGTKRQAQETIEVEATRCGMPYVTNRWLGGMLTNWRTIRSRINELERLERMRDGGDFARITKKEGLVIQRQIDRLLGMLSGVRTLVRIPDVLFVVDVHREATAIHEANLLGIPVVAMVDTNCDPRNVDYIIPSNDDAIRAIKLIVGKVAEAVIEGKAMRKDEEIETEALGGMMEEAELADEDLLGESTLAKISTTRTILVSSDEDEIEGFTAEEEGVGESAEVELTTDEAEEEPAELITDIDEGAEKEPAELIADSDEEAEEEPAELIADIDKETEEE
jgi:small subunit ribosomal protein S2